MSGTISGLHFLLIYILAIYVLLQICNPENQNFATVLSRIPLYRQIAEKNLFTALCTPRFLMDMYD
jgi:hypothetical protein